jgi:hypothetical protein
MSARRHSLLGPLWAISGHRRTAPQNAANAAASLRFRHNPQMPINSGLQGELVRYACGSPLPTSLLSRLIHRLTIFRRDISNPYCVLSDVIETVREPYTFRRSGTLCE